MNNWNRFDLFFVLLIVFASCGFSTSASAQTPNWLMAIESEEDFNRLSLVNTSSEEILRETKYLIPAREDDTLLSTVYQNVNVYPFHIEFMAVEFPGYFAGITVAEYLDLVQYRATRDYYAGALFQIENSEGGIVYGFDYYSDIDEPVEKTEVAYIYHKLSETFHLAPLAYAPTNPIAIEIARGWGDTAEFPIYLPGRDFIPQYEAYSQAVNYGRIRMIDLDDLEKAIEDGEIGWQDIVVLDAAPTDIERVVAGVITGTRQGELSHINVRSIRRGTPNAYMSNAQTVFNPYKDQLVRLEIGADSYQITAPADLTEAEAWWAEHRPQLAPLPQPDDTFTELVSLDRLAVNELSPSRLTARHGGKATGMGLLYTILEPEILVEGFSIPFHYYVEFMQSNMIPHPDNRGRLIPYQEFVELTLQDPRFRSDSEFRNDRLDDLRDYMRDYGAVNPQLVEDIMNKIVEVFGSTAVKVRFRSSSNTEDNLEFNGAGLYDSTSVCAEDTLDDDNQGPSLCDPDEKDERTIERGLIKVWASLWNLRAFEEREYYQIDHLQTRMGIMVSLAFPREDSNGVAFTGDPIAGNKDFYVINVQQGDESVVQPGTGIIPEKILLKMNDDGTIGEISRLRGSSLLPAGEWILTDDQLAQLSALLFRIDRDLPVELGEYSRDEVYMDVEFKFDNGELVLKQVRPTLMRLQNTEPNEDHATLHIPEGTRVVGVFQEGRGVKIEHDMLAVLTFKPGDHQLPLAVGEYPLDIVDEILYTPDRMPLPPLDDGKVIVTTQTGSTDQYSFKFVQNFDVDGIELDLTWTLPPIQMHSTPEEQETFILNEPYLSRDFYMFGRMLVGVRYDYIFFASETYEGLPLYILDVQLEEGQSIQLHQRWLPALAGTGPSNLVFADVNILEGHVQQNDYWRLVYAAEHHNWDEVYWVLFDPPLNGDTYGVAVSIGDSFIQGDEKVYTLDEFLEPLRYINVRSLIREEVQDPPTPTPTPTPTVPAGVDGWWKR